MKKANKDLPIESFEAERRRILGRFARLADKGEVEKSVEERRFAILEVIDEIDSLGAPPHGVRRAVDILKGKKSRK